MNQSLKVIAVDLTPILPGGENGGAKIFVLELLVRLAAMEPQTQFILLTQAASHEELAVLDRSNMRRVMVVGATVSNSIRLRLQNLASRLLPHLPSRLRRIVSRMAYRLNSKLKQGGSGSLLRDMNVNLLFCPFTAPTFFELGTPIVCTIYDLQYKTYSEFFAAEDVAHREHTFLEACRKATVLTAISDYSRNSAIAHGKLDPKSIRTIYLRMAQRIVPEAPQDLDILDRFKLVPYRYLMYPANFWRHKNHEMLLTAFSMACHDGLAADIKLVCTGAPGERQEWLMKAAQAMDLGPRVIFPGYLPHVELGMLMGSCLGVVFPSLYEGFGLPVIEAMAAGVPVACSDRTSLPEVAADAAILFDPRVPTDISQAIISLAENAALRERLIQAGLQRANEFSDSTRMAHDYWELFQLAVRNKNRENLLTGIYSDSWASPCMNIQVAPAKDLATLEIEFSAPEFLPHPKVTIEAYCGSEVIEKSFEIQAGNHGVLSLPLTQQGGVYELRFSPVFVPAICGMGDDNRELAVMVCRCVACDGDKKYVALYPEQAVA